ncbi:winged helix-turn-helix transcriptional regulator [Pseudodesulfovibrio piezophilus]|uniref:Putative transcriptional regulator n=1 Tax=Pseudodesulfovibrio piezophilus (strain DSM 21447 / JCM 15486 / C1TLV30) TaxID=1322246 RepID=M1WTT7_PSEP2|nr:winged helix-turn-helix transcriptional regulator [Pseudodesulfovibrio piezophilus]CCH49877.1 putative transcriptional regulator [Pseudodesulfovibrio piezophilus C1TLV30]
MSEPAAHGIKGMLITDGLYLKPSKSTRVLAILEALTRDSNLSQFELGRRLNLSGAMVNQYLKQLQEGGLVEFLPVNGKSYHYTLTDKGKQVRRDMFSDYSSETIRLYTTIKDFVLENLRGLLDEGKTRLALFGASETCEVVLSALRDTKFQIMILLDNDPKKQGQLFNGHVVSAPQVMEQVDCDAVVITSFGKQAEIYEQLKPYSEKRGFQIVRF